MGRRTPLLDDAMDDVVDGVERQWVLLAAGGLFLLIFFTFAGRAWPMGMYRLLSDGLLVVLWLIACGGVGYWTLRLFRQAGLTTSIALGIGIYSIALLGLGLVGGLNRITAWGLIAVGFAAALAAMWRSEVTLKQLAPWLRRSIPQSNWLWLLIVPFFAIAVVAAFLPPGILWGAEEPNGYDVVEYHLQVPREWFELGRILPLKHNVFSYFPFNVEVHYLWAMHLRGGPWAGMYLAQLMHLAMVVLSVAAVYQFVGRKGLLGVLIAAATPWLTMLGSIAYNEGGVLLFGVLSITWALRALGATTDRSRLIALAGVFAGLACGVKLTAIPMVLLFVPLAFVIACNFRGDLVRPALLFLICGIAAFSPWLLRNLVWAKNPVFPEAMSLLGRAHFSPEQEKRWQLAYVPPPAENNIVHRVNAIGSQILADWRFGYALFPAVAILVIALVRGRTKIDSSMVLLFALLLAWLILWAGFTHLQGRFFVLAVPVAALLIARIDSPIARLAVICALLLQVGFGLLNLTGPISKTINPIIEAGAMGLEDYRDFQERYRAAADAKADVCLIGDAKVFFYQTPSARLHYRTVFDVDVRGRGIIDAWADGCTVHVGDIVDVDVGELMRFHKTYYGIPAPPEETPATSQASGKP